jgi:hypothetical protein
LADKNSPEKANTQVKNNRKTQIQQKRSASQNALGSIRSFAEDLYQKYANDFLDPDFSRRIALSLSQDLYELDVESLQDLHDGLTNSYEPRKLKVTFLYNPPKGSEKYQVQAFKGGIYNPFPNNYVPRKTVSQGVNIQLPMIQYIRQRIIARNQDLERKWSRTLQDNRNKQRNLCGEGECHLTIPELVDGITQHLIVRGNLIGAIRSVLPDENGEGSIIQTRLESLLQGEFCLPPRWGDLDQMDEKQRTQEIAHYLQATNVEMCQKLGGFPLKMEESKMNELEEGATPMASKYWDYAAAIQESYFSSVQELRNILKLLEGMHAMNNAELNSLTEKTKKILDDLYSQTEIYYLLAVLSLLEVDFSDTRKQEEKKQRRRERLIKGNLA